MNEEHHQDPRWRAARRWADEPFANVMMKDVGVADLEWYIFLNWNGSAPNDLSLKVCSHLGWMVPTRDTPPVDPLLDRSLRPHADYPFGPHSRGLKTATVDDLRRFVLDDTTHVTLKAVVRQHLGWPPYDQIGSPSTPPAGESQKDYQHRRLSAPLSSAVLNGGPYAGRQLWEIPETYLEQLVSDQLCDPQVKVAVGAHLNGIPLSKQSPLRQNTAKQASTPPPGAKGNKFRFFGEKPPFDTQDYENTVYPDADSYANRMMAAAKLAEEQLKATARFDEEIKKKAEEAQRQKAMDEVLRRAAAKAKAKNEYINQAAQDWANEPVTQTKTATKKAKQVAAPTIDDVMIIVKQWYRRASLLYHPDRGGSIEKFKILNELHRSLLDELEKLR